MPFSTSIALVIQSPTALAMFGRTASLAIAAGSFNASTGPDASPPIRSPVHSRTAIFGSKAATTWRTRPASLSSAVAMRSLQFHVKQLIVRRVA